MLVLTRKRLEMIRIGEDVIIKVLEIGPRVVRLGIEAPPAIRVIRPEALAKHGPQHPPAVLLEQRRGRSFGITPLPTTRLPEDCFEKKIPEPECCSG